MGRRRAMTVDFLMKYFLAAIGGAIAIMLLFYFTNQGVLVVAAKYADDEPKLVKFMRDMGYPKTGEWCGEFAASVIKRAGGTPPSGAAIASNWRGYGTPDAMPHVGDVAVADRGVLTGAAGSHVGFVTDVDLKSGTFTLESGNSGNIYTTRKISCFSFHMPPNNVLSALTGNVVPSGTAIGNALTGLPLGRASIGAHPFVPAISSPNPDDCSQGSLDTDNYVEIQNDDGLHRVQALANSLDGERVCVLHLPPFDAPRFCPYARMTRESIMYRPYRRCTATTTKGKQCLAWRVRASACFI
jgi:CHAP domain